MDSEGEGAADADSAPKAKKKIIKGPAENKSKKEHINVVFIGHVGTYNVIDLMSEFASFYRFFN